MTIRAILETETVDPDFREPFLNGMPFDITESTFDRIVRYASGCTDVQQPDIIAMALVVMAFPTNKFQPKTVWEHYCKYTLGIHPSQATEDQYDYFLDCWSGDDEYTYLYDYYENKYPEYNHQLKHYGK